MNGGKYVMSILTFIKYSYPLSTTSLLLFRQMLIQDSSLNYISNVEILCDIFSRIATKSVRDDLYVWTVPGRKENTCR